MKPAPFFRALPLLAATLGARADFDGPFAVPNWLVSNTTGGGSVAHSSTTLELTTGTGAGILSYFVTTPSAVSLDFDWNFYNHGASGTLNTLSYFINGDVHLLSDGTSGGAGDGATVTALHLQAGDTFGFRMDVLNSLGGANFMSVNGFSATALSPVPEPSAWATIGVGVLGLAWLARQRRGSA